MIYVLTDGEECESIVAVLRSRAPRNIVALQDDYHERHKGKSREDFVRWLLRSKGFERVEWKEYPIFDYRPAPRQRKSKKGTFARMVEDNLGGMVKEQLEQQAGGIERQQRLLDRMGKDGRVTFITKVEP